MRIAHITATFPPYYGGTGTVCYHNAVRLARLGHEVTVFTAGRALPEGWRDPPEIAVQRLPALFRFGNAPLLPGLINLKGYDIVHLHYPFFFGAELVAAAAKLSGFRYVVTYHQDVLFSGSLRYPEALHHRLVGRGILGGAAKLIATSTDYAAASRLREFLASGLVAEMPNGVDAERFTSGIESQALHQRYRLRPDDSVVLFVGALDRAHYFKGIPTLLQAMSLLRTVRAHLVIVGEGDLATQYRQAAARAGLADRVTFAGRVPDGELPAHYALSDVAVLPSTTMGEAFGIVLLEAMACGKPVIASNLPGVRSVVAHDEDGLLVAPGDAAALAQAIEAILGDRQRSAEMGRRGRAKVEDKFAWHRIIPRLAALYDQVVHSADTRG